MFASSWRRPKSPVHPEVWKRFEKTNKGGQVLKLRVETFTEKYKEDVLDMFINHFMREEAFHSTAGCSDCPEYLVMFRKAAEEILIPQDVTLICTLDEDVAKPKMVAFNMCAVCHRGDEMDISNFMNTDAGAKLISIWMICKEKFPDTYELHGQNTYLGSLALSVLPEYRGMNISLELLLARIPLCKQIGLKWTITNFTGAASQKVAVKAGFIEQAAVSYEEIEEAIGFKMNTTSKSTKLLSLKIE